MSESNAKNKISKKTIAGFVTSAVALIVGFILEYCFPDLVKAHPNWARAIPVLAFAAAIGALTDLLRLRKKYREGLFELKGRRKELEERERTTEEKMIERIRFSETGEDGLSKYLITKIEAIISKSNDEDPKNILIVGPFDTETKDAILELINRKDGIQKLEWYITESTLPNRISLIDVLEDTLKKIKVKNLPADLYLTGELPIFSRVIFIPGKAIIIFLGNTWMMWNLENHSIDSKVIKEKIFLTPFSKKIKQFFEMREVHEAISCYLSMKINTEGFVINGTHPYPLLFTPYKKIFSEFTKHQGMLIKAFEAASVKLKSESELIISNLPLTENYQAIIYDEYTKQWLRDLKNEADSRKELKVIRYIYIQSEYSPEGWKIEKKYSEEICSFLKEDFFTGFEHNNYTIRCVLTDRGRLEEEYRQYASGSGLPLNHQFSLDEFVSNWIWFKCKGGYDVLQYEQRLPVEQRVAKAIADRIEEPIDKWKNISLFMFCDSYPRHDSDLMNKYNNFKSFLSQLTAPLAISLEEFLTNYCSNSKNSA